MTQDFFQCLVCESFFGNLWKVEKHIKQHQEDDGTGTVNDRKEVATPVSCRRRGMLPIKKVTFTSCYVPVVKNQIDPAFLELCSEVVAKEEPPMIKEDFVADDFLEVEFNDYDNFYNIEEPDTKVSRNRKPKLEKISPPPSPILGPRRSRLRAGQNIRRVAAILLVPDQQDDITDEQYEDMEVIENLLNSDSEEDDTDFLSARSYVSKKHCSTKRKAGRPFGSISKRKVVPPQRPLIPKKRKSKKKTPNLANWKSCEYCSKSFPAKTQLNAHIIQNHRDKVNTILCPVNSCGTQFLNFVDFREHLKLHCKAERKQFAAVDKLKTDQSSTEDEQLACKFCLERFVSLPALQDHITEDHNTDDILKCPCCDKEAPEDDIINFIGHIKGFHPERVDPFNERVKMAEEREQMEKPFKCDKCDMAFSNKYQINSHAKKHEKQLAQESDPERRFPCPVCKMRFKQKDNLRRHFTLHLENNPFVCDFPGCKRKFNSDYNLRRHRALHYENSVLGQRFRCPLCSASFSRKDKLPSHFRNFHKPSEMASIGNGPQRRYQCRLPHVRRVPKYDKNIPPSTTTTVTVEESNASEATVKQELTTSIVSSEEIHLVDKIILDADGNAIHVKGEHLSPEDSEVDKSNTYQSSIIAPPPPSDTHPIQRVSISSLITSDPLYKELNKQDPKKVQDVLSHHYNYMTGSTSFRCHLCEAVFSRAWTLQLHLKATHNKTIMDQKQLESQSATSNGGNKITLMCGQCAYPGKNASDLKKHMETSHVNAPVFKCSKCGYMLRTQKRLDEHIREIHSGARNIKCRFCIKTFSVKRYAQIHEKKVHNNSAAPIEKKPCPVEGCKKMLAPTTYSYHIKRHETAKIQDRVRNDKSKDHRHKCMLCGDVLSCAKSLRRHIDAIHLGKPVNLGQRKGLKGRDKNPKPKKRGPKTPGDEWFLPLLQKALGIDTNRDDDGDNNDKLDDDKRVPSENQTEPTGVDAEDDNAEGFASILGF